MKTATVRELRNDFGRISKWLDAGEVVQVLKRGKAFARISPEPRARGLLGSMKGTADLPKDLEAPLNVNWDATK